MLDDTPPGPILLVYEVENFEQAVELYHQMKFRKSLSIFGSPEELRATNLDKLECGALYLNQAPSDSALPTAGWGYNSNVANGGTDILHQLIRKRFCFGLDLLDALPTEEEVVSETSRLVTLIEDNSDSSEEDYGDW